MVVVRSITFNNNFYFGYGSLIVGHSNTINGSNTNIILGITIKLIMVDII
jgi:cation transport regulator ChaC